MHVLPDYKGFLLAILPPGAFIGLGLLIAAQQLAQGARAQRTRAASSGCGMKPPLKRRVPKPRNPFVALAIARKARRTRKTGRAKRQAEKQALNKRLAEQ